MEEALYDTCILIELIKKGCKRLEGYTTILNIVEFPKALTLKGLTVLYPEPSDYKLAIIIVKELLKRGTPVPAIDVVIAAVAVNRDLRLITLDEHFRIIKEVEPRLKLEIGVPGACA